MQNKLASRKNLKTFWKSGRLSNTICDKKSALHSQNESILHRLQVNVWSWNLWKVSDACIHFLIYLLQEPGHSSFLEDRLLIACKHGYNSMIMGCKDAAKIDILSSLPSSCSWQEVQQQCLLCIKLNVIKRDGKKGYYMLPTIIWSALSHI